MVQNQEDLIYVMESVKVRSLLDSYIATTVLTCLTNYKTAVKDVTLKEHLPGSSVSVMMI